MARSIRGPIVTPEQKCIVVLWPSFLVAGVCTGLFFSAFDPADLFPFGIDSDISRLGAYTIGFFVFWAISAIAGIGTLYFTITNCRQKNPTGPCSKD